MCRVKSEHIKSTFLQFWECNGLTYHAYRNFIRYFSLKCSQKHEVLYFYATMTLHSLIMKYLVLKLSPSCLVISGTRPCRKPKSI